MPSLSDFSPEQTEKIRAWVAEGLGLSEVQRRIFSEFGVTLTYLDARLLMADLQVTPVTFHPSGPHEPLVDPAAVKKQAADQADGEDPVPAGAGVTLSVDQVVIPGAMVSGKATFSDGKSASWYVDSAGRLGFDPDEPGYRPGSEDLLEFQQKLRDELTRGGY